ncbi:MAG: dihydrodipicolinate synthase family protein [Chlamydiales bacterium]|nr:dihydrodipicolinate synthase family protein [Chlamydiales bacterium]
MNSKPLSPLSGVFPAVATPLTADGSIDLAALADHCKDMIHRGCRGIVLFGSSGEGVSFSVKERLDGLNHLLKEGINPKQIILAAICTATSEAIELSRHAVSKGCLAVLLAPPFYYQNVTEAGVIAFYRDVIVSTNTPELRVLLYHIPKLTGVPITLKIIKALQQEFPNQVVGMKDSDGDVTFAKMILEQRPDFNLFIAQEHLIAQLVGLGACGAISGLANAYPEHIVAQYKSGLNGTPSAAFPLLPAIQAAFQKYPVFPTIKSLIALQKGPSWLRMRPPLQSLTEEEQQALRATLEDK